MRLIFEWDKTKASSNLRKHKVGFDEARTVFRDDALFTFRDDENSDDEERFISIGISENLRILLVVHTEVRQSDDEMIIRIISARKATAKERAVYEER